MREYKLCKIIALAWIILLAVQRHTAESLLTRNHSNLTAGLPWALHMSVTSFPSATKAELGTSVTIGASKSRTRFVQNKFNKCNK